MSKNLNELIEKISGKVLNEFYRSKKKVNDLNDIKKFDELYRKALKSELIRLIDAGANKALIKKLTKHLKEDYFYLLNENFLISGAYASFLKDEGMKKELFYISTPEMKRVASEIKSNMNL